MAKSAVRSRKRLPTPTYQPFEESPVASGGLLHDNLRLHIEYVSPKELKPPKRKLRKHPKRQLEGIQSSVRENGFIDPLLVNGEREIVCGYGRWLAAIELNLELVPVITLEHLSPEQLRLYAIAENRLGDMSEFDLGELKLEFVELQELNADLNLEQSQFSTSEIDDLVYGKDPDFGGGEGPKPAGPPVTVLGDLWQLGDHLLYCGNALEAGSFEALMGGEKAGMVFTDPPYNVPASAISGKGKHKSRDFGMAAGEMSSEEFTRFIATYSQHLVDFSVDGSIHYHCMDWRHMGEMLAGGKQVYSELKNLIVFAKHSAGLGTFYRSQHELIFAWKAGKAPHVNNFGLGETGRHRSNLWSYKGNAGFHRDRDDELAAHPTVKPTSLVADAIRDCSKRGAIILDCFGGLGTTAIAAERTGRKARLIELDPLYCDATIRRREKLVDEHAILVATGQTFAEVAEARGVDIARDDDDDAFEPDDDAFSDDAGEDA